MFEVPGLYIVLAASGALIIGLAWWLLYRKGRSFMPNKPPDQQP